MPLLVLALVGFLLALWPSGAPHAAASCADFPPGSLSRSECEHIQAQLQQQKAMEASRSQWVDLPLRSASAFLCPDESAVEIGNLEGAPGEEIRGTYRNVAQQGVHEVIVSFALYNERSQFVTRIDAPVLPRTIPPGGTGTFSAAVPSPSTRGWTCFRYEITGLAD
jgi:hypothetical protein